MKFWNSCAAVLLAMGLTACAPVPTQEPVPGRAPTAVIPEGARLYRVVPAESQLRVLVYRGGRLGSLGHNHVISSRAVTGIVGLAASHAESVLYLNLPVDSLEVDRPELRDAEGDDFPGHLDGSAIAGTRANMLGEKLLDAAHYPQIEIRSRAIEGELPDLNLRAEITVRDHVATAVIPVHLQIDDQQLVAEGSFDLTHKQLGLEPFSVMLGALTVQDAMQLKFKIVARHDQAQALQ